MVRIINGSLLNMTVRLLTPTIPAPPLDFPGKMFLPFDLTGVTDITTCFQNSDGTETMLSLGSGISVVGNPSLGTILINATALQTAKFIPVTGQALELAISFGGDPTKYQIPDAYEVVTGLC